MACVTLVMAYYENPGMLMEHYRHFQKLPSVLRNEIEVVIVDDGSPRNPAFPPPGNLPVKAFNGQPGKITAMAPLGLRLRIYRMDHDIPWNQDAARNIGVFEARSPFVLLTDMDHIVPEQTWREVLFGTYNRPHIAYRFTRVNWPDGDPYHPHPNSWLLAKELFCRVWYDERFAGIYGTDGDFAARLFKQALEERIPFPLMRVSRTQIPDASTVDYSRDRSRLPERKDLAEKRGNGPPQKMTNPYRLVYAQ